MHRKLYKHWKFTTFLFVVVVIELIIVALYLSVPTSPNGTTKRPFTFHSLFSIAPPPNSQRDEKPLDFQELFKRESGIEKRLPHLLHDYFKQTQSTGFSSPELVELLNLELGQIKQFAIRKDAIVIHINPHDLSADTGTVAIAIKKDLLANELKDEHMAAEGTSVSHSDYEIATLPLPGNTLHPQEKMLALTFDDGPDGNTHVLLDILERYQANATFFVLGQKVAGGAGILQRMVRNGHEVGNHSWSHPDLRRLSAGQVHSQIADTQNAIKNASGVAPTLMRPPYGATNSAVEAIIRSQGLHQAMWTIDSNDWRDKDAELLYQRIMSSAKDGAVVLLHDIHSSSVQATLRAIPDLKSQGYQLVTMTQLEAYR